MKKKKLDLLSPKELEQWLGITVQRQNHLRNIPFYRDSENPIPFYKITGLGVRYKPSEILEWIKRQKVIRNAKNRT